MRQPEGKTNRNLIFTTLTQELLRTNAFLGVSPRLWLNISKHSKDQHCLILNMPEYPKEYLIPVAFPLQNFLYERASKLNFTYVAYLVKNCRYIRYAANEFIFQ